MGISTFEASGLFGIRGEGTGSVHCCDSDELRDEE
jgi:hypothetical protein